MTRIVDVFLGDRLAMSYPIAWRVLNEPIADGVFIDLAKEAMQRRGFRAGDIAGAKYSVRSVPKEDLSGGL